MAPRWHAVVAGLRRLFRKSATERDLDDEVQHFVEEATEEYRRAGLSPDDAARAARVELGSAAAVKEQVRGGGWEATIESIWRDVLYGVRTLRRSPGFTVVAVIVLALSIGANTAIFSLINAILLRPLPVRAPSELAFVYKADPRGGVVCTYEELRSYRADQDVFVDLASWNGDRALFGRGADTADVAGESVSANYFDLLGLSPRMGRAFIPDVDEAPGSAPVVVISDLLWRRQFNADPNILGRTIPLRSSAWGDSGWRYAVVGVMGPEFTGVTSPWDATNFWVPLLQRNRERNSLSSIQVSDSQRTVGVVIGRRRPGVTIAQAQAFVTARHDGFKSSEAPLFKVQNINLADRSLVVQDSRRVRLPLDDAGRMDPSRLAGALMAVAGLVLLLGIANLVGVTIARGIVRRPEIAVRLTLGASRGRLARQLVTEGLLLSALGGLGGLVASRWLVSGFLASLSSTLGTTAADAWQQSLAVPLDLRVLSFTVLVVLGVGLVVGLAPVRQAAKTDLLSALAGTAEVSPRRLRSRLRHWIVIPQVCVCAALLLAAGMSVRFLLKITLVDPGYQPDGVAVVSFTLPPPTLAGLSAEEWKAASQAWRVRTERLHRRVLEIVAADPAVTTAGLTQALPLNHMPVTVVAREGFSNLAPHYTVATAGVTPGYFPAIGQPLRLGRAFEAGDTRDAPKVAIVDETAAAWLWPGTAPIGQYFALHHPATTNRPVWLEVVGVVGDVRTPLSEGEPRPSIYVPLSQETSGYFVGSLLLVACGRGTDLGLIDTLRAAVGQADPDANVTRSQTLSNTIDRIRYPRRLSAALLVSSALVGLFLAGFGLYGVVSYSVAQRLKELGIRAALGADRADLLTLVIREGATVAVIGSVLGFALAFAGIRLVSHQVFAMPAMDIGTIVVIPLPLAAVVLLACYLPARRAARVDPMVVLRWL